MEEYTQKDSEDLRGLRLALGLYALLFALKLAAYFATGILGGS